MDTVITVETWNEQTGEWWDLGEAESLEQAKWRITGLAACDKIEDRTSRYRIVTTTTEEVNCASIEIG